jgi:hypothetical protein
MLPFSELTKRGSTPKNWSAMLDSLKKMLVWFAAMLTGATFRRGSAPGHSQELTLGSPVTILFCTATRMETAPATASAAKNKK